MTRWCRSRSIAGRPAPPPASPCSRARPASGRPAEALSPHARLDDRRGPAAGLVAHRVAFDVTDAAALPVGLAGGEDVLVDADFRTDRLGGQRMAGFEVAGGCRSVGAGLRPAAGGGAS